jgi:hypothetical protein
MKYANTFPISRDWLQLHVRYREDFLDFTPFFRFKRKGKTRAWKDVYDIYDLFGNLVAIYGTNGNENGILKLHNTRFYIHEDLRLFIVETLDKLGMEFIGLTKEDIVFELRVLEDYKVLDFELLKCPL